YLIIARGTRNTKSRACARARFATFSCASIRSVHEPKGALMRLLSRLFPSALLILFVSASVFAQTAGKSAPAKPAPPQLSPRTGQGSAAKPTPSQAPAAQPGAQPQQPAAN